MTREEYINKRLEMKDDPSQKLAIEISTIKYFLIKANIFNSEDFEKTYKIIREKGGYTVRWLKSFFRTLSKRKRFATRTARFCA